MALSIISIPGDGVTDTFTVSFALGILDRTSTTAWVTGEVDGGGNKVYRTITYLTDTLLKLSGAKPGNGVMVVFTRTVSQTSLIVNYEDGDIMNETNLNTAQKQALMLVHQVLDGRFSAFIQNVSAGGFKITNLGTPTVATDAATKGYVDSVVATGAASAAAAAVSAAAALASQGAAATSASTATTQAGTATTQAGIATTQAGLALGYRADALTYSNNASASATLAQKWAAELEDVVVSGGLYSAFHWAQKAAAIVAGGFLTAFHGSPSKGTLVDADELPIWNSVGGVVGKLTWLNLKANVLGYFNATAKGTPVDADRVWQGNSATANTPVYSTWTQIKAFLQTYFDTLYAAVAHTHTFASLTSKPTTIAGYSISDVKGRGTAVATTSGVAIDITGIPSWVTRIDFSVAGLSTSGTSLMALRIGTASGVEATGYLGAAVDGAGSVNLSTGFGFGGVVAATDIVHGNGTLVLLDAATNTWTYSWMGGLSNTTGSQRGGGSKSLVAVLDRIRLTTVGGTDTFDAGKINIVYS